LYTDRLKLNHKNKVFSIAYTALNYSAPQKTCYHYKLEGFDPEWNIDKTGSRQATYTNLDPGEYIFKLKATNNDGVLGDITRELHITIQPAWWETGLFKFILGSTLLLIAFLLFRMRTRQLKKQKDTLKEKVERRTEELRKKNQVLTERQNELLEKNEEIGKMSEKIQDLNQARLRFYTNVSHEIRTPLTLMITPTQKLLQTSPETPISNVRSSIEMIDKNEKRLLQLINQLLEIRKIETGKLRLNLQTGDLMQELEEIAILFQQAAAECKIDYSFHFTKSDDKGAEIVYDRDKLEKIAFNLISNAFKFTRKGDKVEVSASLTDQILQFNVSDTGVGIKPDMIDKIFDRFSSQSPENEHFSNSSGIGLAYVKELVEIHKGQIEVKSQNGKSTEFKVRISVSRQAYPGEHFSETSYYRRSERTVDLPQRLEVDREDQNADAPGFRHNSPVNHSLLIVEDNTELQRLLAEHLRKFFKIRKASDGVEGKQIVLQNKPDIILCDIMMPRMNGMELCKELKSKIETSHIPIVLLTAKSNQEDQLSGISEGADDYIVKPFDLNLLTAKLLNLVKIRDRLKERFGQETTLLPESLGSNEMDESFLREVVDFIRNNIQDNELNAERIAKELRVSRSFVYQKISALSGNTVNEFIRIIRLKVACELMKNPALSLSEIAYTSGFTSLNYFSRSFKQQFKQLPSEYRKSLSPKE
jgi:signal transduction histidine kinase/DNA-binding response OmpR family regulator